MAKKITVAEHRSKQSDPRDVTGTNNDLLDKRGMDVNIIGGSLSSVDPIAPGATLPAGETISALKLIYTDSVSMFIADPTTTIVKASAIGIAITGGVTGVEIRYLLTGLIYDSSFSFTPGQQVYLDSNGGLTQTDPDTLGLAYRVLIGTAQGSNAININIQEPIEL